MKAQSSLEETQARIDDVPWYHEFAFPNGLVARARNQARGHRRVWAFIRSQLDLLDFTDKTVLDLGCWDGYWSFYAEQRGAGSVLATDDSSQNWAGSAGLELAKELLGSSIDTRLDVSVYDLSVLDQSFDVILCMGIYYHLLDPFYALAQIRHLCHAETVIVFEGDTAAGIRRNHVYFNPRDPTHPIFVPRSDVLATMLRAAYFDVTSQVSIVHHPVLNWREYARLVRAAAQPSYRSLPRFLNRTVTVCRPSSGRNELHPYPPPFGLHRYDDRWAGDSFPRRT